MNTSFRFLIFTIFIALGFITSCNDDINSTEEDNNNQKTNIASTEESTSIEDEDEDEILPPPYDADEIDKINPKDLSKQIKEIGEKIEILEKESSRHYDEYSKMSEIQKAILENVRIKRIIMKSKTVGSEEEKIAKIDFENEKKYGREKLEILKEKNHLLYNLTKSIAQAKEEKEKLQEKEKYLLKRKKKKEKAKLN
ncbi:hypothetical protein [Blattabacterium cuenoti]|uniref:hypothetical protein n=1 Tax=Blattabacterium cuenoti TaxID=1653831 RepID=UPI00163C71E9|nr:hypothetical protein [Blattabacterium cuenoti]